MKKLFFVLSILFFSVSLSFGQTHKRFHYDYKKFGFLGSFGTESVTYDGSNVGPINLTQNHFSFAANFVIQRGLNLDDTVDLAYKQNDYYLGSKIVMKTSQYFLDFGKERHDSVSPYVSILQLGRLGAYGLSSGDISNSDFLKTVAPAFRFVTVSNTPATLTNTPRLIGGGLQGSFALGLRLAPSPLVSFDTSFGAVGGIKMISVTGSDLFPFLQIHYALMASQKILFSFEQVEPWIEGRAIFLEKEQGLGSSYSASIPFRWTVFLGLQFKFSLLLFG